MALKLKEGFKGSRMTIMPSMTRDFLISNPITSDIYITDIGYFPRAEYHYINRPRGAAEYIWIFCTDGKGWIKCNGQNYCIKSGEFFIIPRNASHSYGADETDPWTIYWVHFNGLKASDYGEGFCHTTRVSMTEESDLHRMLDVFEEIYIVLKCGYNADNLKYACNAFKYFLGYFIFNPRNPKEAQTKGTREYSETDLIERCHRYLNERIEGVITLNDICVYTGYSPSRCTAIFKKNTGMTPIQYLQNLRIQKAAHLMYVYKMRVNQVCYKVGITDPYYFSRLFTRIMGISPFKYKRAAGRTK